MVDLQTVFTPNSLSQELSFIELKYYFQMLNKHIDLVKRQLLKDEIIPHNEKIFSLFEPHTKWISKGESGVIAEFGEKHLIVTNQNHFIVLDQIIADKLDANFTINITEKRRINHPKQPL